MSERGLAANLLWLAESEYPAWDGTKPGMSIAVWTQYVLDNFATVKEAVAGMESAPFVIATGGFPGQEELKATLHLAVSDASGDSEIFEFIKGKPSSEERRVGKECGSTCRSRGSPSK